MPRTTTPHRKWPRLFRPQAGLSAEAVIELDRTQAHYLLDVMRRKVGDKVRLFNGQDGEWLASVVETARRSCRLGIEEQLRPQHEQPGPTLLFAPIKKARMEILVEKATELGVGRLMPVATRRSMVDKVNTERLSAIAIEAAEQCERLTVPEISELRSLDTALGGWPDEDPVYVADETGGGKPLLQVLKPEDSASFLVGPEGGFDPTELERLGEHPAVVKVDLGPLILRAETAAIVVLAMYGMAAQRS